MTFVVLKRPHTHAGQPCRAGDRIEVDADIADWLVAHGIADPAPRPFRDAPETKNDSKPFLRKEPKL